MNTQNPNTNPAPKSCANGPNPAQTLEYIEALSDDVAFSTQPPSAPNAPNATNAQNEPIRSDVDQLIGMAFKYGSWIFSSFITWIAILILSSMLIGPALRSIAIIASGERTGLAAFGNTAALFSIIAFYGFALGRDRDFAKRICQSSVIGSLLALGGGLWVLVQPGNLVWGLGWIAAQLAVLAIAVYAGSRIPKREKTSKKKGVISRVFSAFTGIAIGMGIVIALKIGGAYLATAAEGSLHNGKAAPTTQYVDVDDNPFVFADCKGKVTLVEFWAPWCGPCVASMPHLCSIQERYGDRQDFAMVSITVSSPRDSATEVFESRGCNWKLLFKPEADKDGLNNQTAVNESREANESPEFRPNGIPSAYIIDRDGKVVASGIRGSDIDAKLAELLSRQAE